MFFKTKKILIGGRAKKCRDHASTSNTIKVGRQFWRKYSRAIGTRAKYKWIVRNFARTFARTEYLSARPRLQFPARCYAPCHPLSRERVSRSLSQSCTLAVLQSRSEEGKLTFANKPTGARQLGRKSFKTLARPAASSPQCTAARPLPPRTARPHHSVYLYTAAIRYYTHNAPIYPVPCTRPPLFFLGQRATPSYRPRPPARSDRPRCWDDAPSLSTSSIFFRYLGHFHRI